MPRASHSRDKKRGRPVLALVSALLGCALLVAYDTQRTLSEVGDRLGLVAALAAAQIAPRDLAAPRSQTFTLPPVLSEDIQFALAAEDGEVLATTIAEMEVGSDISEVEAGRSALEATAPIAGALGSVTVSLPHSAIAATIAQRAAVIFAIVAALLMLAHVVMRGARKSSPDDVSFDPALDATPHGLARWGIDGTLVYANASFGRLLRIDAEAICPGSAYGEFSKTIKGKISARPVLDSAHQRMVEVEREDGTSILLDERPCPSGGFVTVATDITDRKRADQMLNAVRDEQRQLARKYHEEKLRAEAASRAKTSFLAHLSHDIRTPLNHIIGFADLIQLETYGPVGDPKYLTYLQDIKTSGQKLLGSFAEILEYAELEGGRRMLKCEPIALRDIISCAESRYRAIAGRGGIRLEVTSASDGILNADRTCIDRMLGNLLDNAIRFTPRGGEIRLAAWVADDGVVIEITDTGVGMPEDQLSRLSQPFGLSDASFTKSHEGIGLGIAIARTIAELSGGRLAIDSVAGLGTTVAICLPLDLKDRGGDVAAAA